VARNLSNDKPRKVRTRGATGGGKLNPFETDTKAPLVHLTVRGLDDTVLASAGLEKGRTAIRLVPFRPAPRGRK